MVFVTRLSEQLPIQDNAIEVPIYSFRATPVDTADVRAACLFPDAVCSEDTDCCAPINCVGGVCTAGGCGVPGQQCMNDGDCCTENCFQAKCTEGVSIIR